MQWMDMKSNTLDCVIGPIETYEDQMFGHKACFEAYVLVKDKDWSKRLAKYAKLLPGLCNAACPCRTNTRRSRRERIRI